MSISWMNRFRRRGSNAVEFAMVSPILIGMTMGIIEYGYYFSQQQGVMTATRHGVRTGAAMPLSEDADVVAIEETGLALQSVGISPDEAQMVASFEGEAPFQVMVLSVVVPYNSITGFPMPLPDTMEAELTMRMEYQPD